MRLKEIVKGMKVTVKKHPDYAGATGTVKGFKEDNKVIVTFKNDSSPRWFYPGELYLKVEEE